MMKAQIVEQIELFLEAELGSLEFLPKELEAIEEQRVPDLDSISFEDIAEELEAYFEGDVEGAQLEGRRGGQNHQAKKGNGFYRTVRTDFQWNQVPDPVRKKVNEIIVKRPAGQNKARFTNLSVHSYWRVGNFRIFGELTPRGFTFVGYGQHQGSTNNKYTVTLPNGTTTARNK